MNETIARVINFPKIQSPFVRQTIDNYYVVTDKIAEGYEWVFLDEGVRAVDKLHGTNICLVFCKGTLLHVDNRSTRLMNFPFVKTDLPSLHARALEGVLSAIEKGWLPNKFDGRIYGELVGPSINCNIHQLEKHYFVPFDYLKDKCHWKSWIKNKYPKNFEAISNWFKELPSLFAQRMLSIETPAEGLVFYHPDGRMAKLRRDMFRWYYD